MEALQNKIDFAVVMTVEHANPNGDPLYDNRPRTTYDGYGEISDVCLKRKIRNRMMDMGKSVFVQSDERCIDGFKSLKERAAGCEELKKASKDRNAYKKAACEKWLDVRAFGQLFAFSSDGDDANGDEKKNKKAKGVSVGVRGPVSIHPAISADPVDILDMQITKSVDGVSDSDRMGMKHRVEFAVYTTVGSINCQLAEMTGFTDEDAECIKEALRTLFENDSSAARPEGSMQVVRVYWWKHNCKSGQYSAARVHHSLHIAKKDGVDYPHSIDDYNITCDELDGLEPEIYAQDI